MASPVPGTTGGGALGTLYVDKMPLDAVNTALAASPRTKSGLRHTTGDRYWSSRRRPLGDPTVDTLEIGFRQAKLGNRVAFQYATFPHVAVVEWYDESVTPAVWRKATDEVTGRDCVVVCGNSVPSRVASYVAPVSKVNPFHTGQGHWQRAEFFISQVSTRRVRLRMSRQVPGGSPPLDSLNNPVAYPLGVRALEYDLYVRTADDLPASTPNTSTAVYPGAPIPLVDPSENVITTASDVFGSTVQYSPHATRAVDLLLNRVWKSEAQPFTEAVVCLYVDARGEGGDPQVIEGFEMEPLTTGATVNIYWSQDAPYDDLRPLSQADYEDLVWTPVPRDFKLRRGSYTFDPTLASHLKLEFTNLTPEPYESLHSITRRVKTFPAELAATSLRPDSNYATPPDFSVSSDGHSINQALYALNRFPDQTAAPLNRPNVNFTPTEAIYSPDPTVVGALRQKSHLYGFKEWHPGFEVTRFTQVGKHVYSVVEVEHNDRVGFFVGLKSLRMFRTDFTVDEDKFRYDEHFHDTQHIDTTDYRNPFTAYLTPGDLHSGPVVTSSGAIAESKGFYSRRFVRGLQYATQQTPPLQLLFDPDFDDPDLNFWQGTDGSEVEIAAEFLSDIGTTVRVTPADGGWAGVASTEFVYPSVRGRIYVAARIIATQALTAPLYVQLVDNKGTVLSEERVTVNANQVTEWFCSYTVGEGGPVFNRNWNQVQSYFEPDATGNTWQDFDNAEVTWDTVEFGELLLTNPVTARVVQKGSPGQAPTGEGFYADNVSVFNDPLIWEFSHDGGKHYYPAYDIRNNPDGVFIFPGKELQTFSPEASPGHVTPPVAEGHILRWRASIYAPDFHVTALSIRPWYGDLLNGIEVRQTDDTGTPDISPADHQQDVHDDPRWKKWSSPIPQEWFFYYRQFLLAQQGNAPGTKALTPSSPGAVSGLTLDTDLAV